MKDLFEGFLLGIIIVLTIAVYQLSTEICSMNKRIIEYEYRITILERKIL